MEDYHLRTALFFCCTRNCWSLGQDCPVRATAGNYSARYVIPGTRRIRILHQTADSTTHNETAQYFLRIIRRPVTTRMISLYYMVYVMCRVQLCETANGLNPDETKAKTSFTSRVLFLFFYDCFIRTRFSLWPPYYYYILYFIVRFENCLFVYLIKASFQTNRVCCYVFTLVAFFRYFHFLCVFT